MDIRAYQHSIHNVWTVIPLFVGSSLLPDKVLYVTTSLVVTQMAAVWVTEALRLYFVVHLHRPEVHTIVALENAIARPVEVELTIATLGCCILALPTSGFNSVVLDDLQIPVLNVIPFAFKQSGWQRTHTSPYINLCHSWFPFERGRRLRSC